MAIKGSECARCGGRLDAYDRRAVLNENHRYPRPLKTGDLICASCMDAAASAGVVNWMTELLPVSLPVTSAESQAYIDGADDDDDEGDGTSQGVPMNGSHSMGLCEMLRILEVACEFVRDGEPPRERLELSAPIVLEPPRLRDDETRDVIPPRLFRRSKRSR